jgi:hypothetical protein
MSQGQGAEVLPPSTGFQPAPIHSIAPAPADYQQNNTAIPTNNRFSLISLGLYFKIMKILLLTETNMILKMYCVYKNLIQIYHKTQKPTLKPGFLYKITF